MFAKKKIEIDFLDSHVGHLVLKTKRTGDEQGYRFRLEDHGELVHETSGIGSPSFFICFSAQSF